MIKLNVRKGDVFCGKCYKVVASAELAERGHKDDCRMGISIAVEETDKGKFWSTHEYNAEQDETYYWGHYFLNDEGSAWVDFFGRCKELAEYGKEWKELGRYEK